MKTETKTLAEVCNDLGLTIDSTPPVGVVQPDGWQCLAFNSIIRKNGKGVWEGRYRVGIGHVNTKGAHKPLSIDEESMLRSWRASPYASFKDKSLQVKLAEKLALAQKVEPKVADVMSSLLLDGDAHFQHQSFKDWCDEFGYSDDSITHEKTYRLCLEVGMALARAFSTTELEQLREAARDY